jgi:hypothetical protein
MTEPASAGGPIMRFAPFLLALAFVAVPAAAQPCAVPAGYVPPTNFQLASDANLIVLGEVVSGGVGSPAEPDAPSITIHPIVALKGLLPGADFKLAGMNLSGEAADGTGDPLAFGPPDPTQLDGGCIRDAFPLHAQALFFLKRKNGQWVPAGGPLSRWAQDVAGLDAPWVQLAGLYAQAAMQGPDDGRDFLEQRHEALVSRTDDPQADAMAADIEQSLATPVRRASTPEPSEPDQAATDARASDEQDDLGEVQQAIDDFGGGR